MMQGDPLSMVAYGIGLFPLTKLPKSEYYDITQPRYTEDVGALGTFDKIELYFNLWTQLIPGMVITLNLQKYL